MATVNGIPLDVSSGGLVLGAVAIAMREKATTDRVFRPDPMWEIELRRGRNNIVARTMSQLGPNALLDDAINMAHIPDERISYSTVSEAYPVLVRLWSEIVRAWLFPGQGSGVVTYQGFRKMIEIAFSQTFVALTADDTEALSSDSVPSPRGHPVSIIKTPASLYEAKPGHMCLSASVGVSTLPPKQAIGRVVLMADSKPVLVSNIEGQLTLSGADVFEAEMTLRLVNLGLPRTEFL